MTPGASESRRLNAGRVFDVAICGGGLVGLATGFALAREHGVKVVILEAEAEVGAHQSRHNSGVIHSGLYYRPGSNKARLCISGRKEMFAFCEENGVPFTRSGKMVLATEETELPHLEALFERGLDNQLQGLVRLDETEIRAREPKVRGIAALWVPQTGITDFGAVADKLSKRLNSAGVEVRCKARVLSVTEHTEGLSLRTAAGPVEAGFLVACAGLAADRVARLCGVDPGLAIVPFRGEYYDLIPERWDLVRSPIYPVPNPALPFLGVHLTPTTSGSIEAGPNAVLAWHRHGYRRGSLSIRDAAAMLSYRGFWRMARQHTGTARRELWRSWSKGAFLKSLQRLVPALTSSDIRRGGTGVRAMAVSPDGTLVDDFRFVRGERSLHMLNAPSPAATASLAIGHHVAKEVMEAL